MGVYINMEMPKSCHECRFYIENIHDRGDDSLCRALGKEVKCGCPLIEVPTLRNNGDGIRQLTNNELALFFWAYVDGKGNSLEQWREWLKQDVHEKAFNKLMELTTNREEGE